METNLTNRTIFRESPELLNGRYSLTKTENSLVMMLLTAIEKEDKDFKDYVFTKKQFEDKTGVTYKTDDLKKYAKSLMSKVLEVKENNEKWKLFTWFSYFEYDNGLITCSFDKRLKPYLLDLQQYVYTNQSYILAMKGQYSNRIYMMLKERMKFGTRKFNVEELMKVLQVKDSYLAYSKFKQGILNQAVKDINRFTDIEIKNLGTAKKPIYFEEKKLVRKVTDVVFHFKKNHNDLKMFIDYIRELHTNEPLFATLDNRILKCSEKGLLYYADEPMAWIDEKKAKQLWEYLHDNRENLFIYNQNSVEDIIKKLQD